MFKSLKDKLKGWITRTKEETEEEIVETPTSEKEIKKKITNKKPTKKEKSSQKTKEKEKKQPVTKKEIKSTPKKLSTTKKALTKKPKNQKDSPTNIEKTNQKEDETSKTNEFDSEEISGNVASPSQEKKGFLSSLFGKKEETKSTITELAPKPEPTKTETKEEEPIKEPKKEKPKLSFFRKALTKEKFEEIFEELELILLQNNVAYVAVENIKKSLEKKLVGESSKIDIEQALKESIEDLLINPPSLIEQIKEKKEKPFVILFAGINGAGKTTTIAKVAHLLKKSKLTICLASADTFRAAAIEQLQVHADKLEIPLIKKDYGADPASVGFDAIKYAKKHKIDVVLIDTAGRMNNRETLMTEIEKISRVNSPDLKIFLGESITGNDATEQAKDFNNSISIDGIILSKADVDEKGGTAISVSQVTKKPIYFLGTGQSYDDLEPFNKENLIKKIFS